MLCAVKNFVSGVRNLEDIAELQEASKPESELAKVMYWKNEKNVDVTMMYNSWVIYHISYSYIRVALKNPFNLFR